MRKSVLHDQKELAVITKHIYSELASQRGTWGAQNHSPEVWMMILGEEVGEAQKAALERWAIKNTNPGYHSLRENKAIELRQELVQVAAVAMSIISSLDRNELNP